MLYVVATLLYTLGTSISCIVALYKVGRGPTGPWLLYTVFGAACWDFSAIFCLWAESRITGVRCWISIRLSVA